MFGWSPFAATRQPNAAPSAPSQVVRVLPTDLGVDVGRLKPAPNNSAPPPSSVDPLKYGSFSQVNPIVGTQPALVLPAPSTKRIYLLIQNTHPTQNIFVGFGNAVTPASGLKIPPGGNYELSTVIPQDDVYLVADGINTTAVLTFSNKGLNESV